jgi:ornithine cyclodeaminase
MGSDAGYKNEIHPGVFSRLDRLVVDRRTQSERLGELHHALDAGALHAGADVAELGQIVTGEVAGRGADDDITLCDLTGTGVQDTAIDVLAARRADAAHAGHTVEN